MRICCMDCNNTRDISDAAATSEAQESVPWEEEIRARCPSHQCDGANRLHRVITAGT